jgi:hypothetical protein
VGTTDPAVGGAELELRQLRLSLDQIQRREHRVGVHAVADRVCHCGHFQTSSVLVRVDAGTVLQRRPGDIGATTQIRVGELAGCTQRRERLERVGMHAGRVAGGPSRNLPRR